MRNYSNIRIDYLFITEHGVRMSLTEDPYYSSIDTFNSTVSNSSFHSKLRLLRYIDYTAHDREAWRWI